MKKSNVKLWIENVGETGCLEPAFKQNIKFLKNKMRFEN